MGVLKGHFRPEFLNRIDEVIVFHSLSRENIRAIVQIQLQRVVRTAAAQDIALKIQDGLVDHLADVGYQPEFGARELKRQIRQELETRLAKEILGDKIKSGDTVDVAFDKASNRVTLTPVAKPPAPEEAAPAPAGDAAKAKKSKARGTKPRDSADAKDAEPSHNP